MNSDSCCSYGCNAVHLHHMQCLAAARHSYVTVDSVGAFAAIPYPARLLSRAVNPISNKVLEYVNAEDSIIVICDWDGTLAAPACALLSEKGVQNAVLLHGGERNLDAMTSEASSS